MTEAEWLTCNEPVPILAFLAGKWTDRKKQLFSDVCSWRDDWSYETAVFRELFGNPFRPVTLDPSWRTSTVLALAEGIYADRAFDRLPILADALQDAGCDSADLLDHCRGPGPHVRGCWAVDLLLGRV